MERQLPPGLKPIETRSKMEVSHIPMTRQDVDTKIYTMFYINNSTCNSLLKYIVDNNLAHLFNVVDMSVPSNRKKCSNITHVPALYANKQLIYDVKVISNGLESINKQTNSQINNYTQSQTHETFLSQDSQFTSQFASHANDLNDGYTLTDFIPRNLNDVPSVSQPQTQSTTYSPNI